MLSLRLLMTVAALLSPGMASAQAQEGYSDGGAASRPPARVVSMNLCTDQLAMALGAPGQLISVSALASDPLVSSMAAEAADYPANYGSAEQVFLLNPDLVLAGTYGAGASSDLLERLGIRVVRVAPVTSLAGVVGQIREVAAAMGQEGAGEEMIRAFEAGLTLQGPAAAPRRAALYYPNGYTTGKGTLADEVLSAGGFENIAAAAGISGGGSLPLERLLLAAPEVIVTSTPYPGASRSEEILRHPALAALRGQSGIVTTTDADWVCGTPHILRAIADLRAAREALE